MIRIENIVPGTYLFSMGNSYLSYRIRINQNFEGCSQKQCKPIAQEVHQMNPLNTFSNQISAKRNLVEQNEVEDTFRDVRAYTSL
jgi:hypothetical protein